LGKAETSMSELENDLTYIERKIYKIKKELKTIRSNEIKEMENQITTEKTKNKDNNSYK
jgi:hypothetical protein